MLICPICKDPLIKKNATYTCDQAHCFDLSREGYLNLTLPTQKRGLGDTKEMLLARRSFLNRGYFDFLILALSELLKLQISKSIQENLADFCLIDSGCGEGYFLGQLSKHLSEDLSLSRLNIDSFGLDISKAGILMGAKRYPLPKYIVADINNDLPFLSKSVDVLLSICAPKNFPEFSRVLKGTGQLIVVMPTPSHMVELRQYYDLLTIDADKEERLLNKASSFRVVTSDRVNSSAVLSKEEIDLYLRMTPNFWHNRISDQSKNTQPLSSLKVSFSFSIISLSLN